MIELKEDGAVTVERLLRDDRLASRVLGQPLLQVKDHPIHDDHAPARVIVRDDVGPRVHADAVLELPKAFGAALLERAAAERARRGGEARQRVHVEGEGAGEALACRLEKEEDAVEGGTIDADLRLDFG